MYKEYEFLSFTVSGVWNVSSENTIQDILSFYLHTYEHSKFKIRATNSDSIYIIYTQKKGTVSKGTHTIIILSHSFHFVTTSIQFWIQITFSIFLYSIFS
jgi:hypothetical protein